MRPPKTRERVYQELRTLVLASPGDQNIRLPTERELALKFHASRGTIRTVLRRLREEFLISSIRSTGTFVRDKTAQPRTITMILPCPDEDLGLGNGGEISRNEQMEAYYGLMKTASANGYDTIFVPFSKTNEVSNADLSRLRRFSRDSLIFILNADWYENFLDFFYDLGCRMVLQSSDKPLKHAHHWHMIEKDTHGTFSSAIERLKKEGFQRIAYASDYALEPPVSQSFQQAYPGTGNDFFIPLTPHRAFGRQILAAWEQKPFDSLIFLPSCFPRVDMRLPLNVNFGLPESVKIILMDDWPLNRRMVQPCPFYAYDHIEIGNLAAKELMRPEFKGGITKVYANYISSEKIAREQDDDDF